MSSCEHSLRSDEIGEYVYRGEGNAHLVLSSVKEKCVLRFRKCNKTFTLKETGLDESRKHIYREVEFITKIISGFLGLYVSIPDVAFYSHQEIARLSDNIRINRPEFRKEKEVCGQYAARYPDFTVLPDEFGGISTTPTFCIEIKPKQGFIPAADQKFSKCPFCLMQYYKFNKRTIKRQSEYCPLDLFSGNYQRMMRAINSLLSAPQNNLKMFKNGQVVYDEQSTKEQLFDLLKELFKCTDVDYCINALCHIVISSLCYPFDGNKNLFHEVEKEATDVTSLEIDSVLDVKLVQKIQNLLIQCTEKCDFSSEPLVEDSILQRIFRMQNLHQSSFDLVHYVYTKYLNFLTDDDIFVRFTDPQSQPNIKFKDMGHLKIDNILKNYLLFCSARDCSIYVTFQEVYSIDENRIKNLFHLNLESGQNFVVLTKASDLDLKNISSIEKHRIRDNEVMHAVLEEFSR